jgi:hypothetical protein
MKRTRLFHLIEGYLDGTLTPAEREELAAAVTADASIRDRFVAQVLLARRLRAALLPRSAGTWEKIDSLTTIQEPARRQRLADGVDAVLDRERNVRRRKAALGWVAAGAAVAVATAFLVARRGGDPGGIPPTPITAAPGPERPTQALAPGPATGPEDLAAPPPATGSLPRPRPPAGAPSPSVARADPAPADPRATLAAEMVAAGEPALAARGDVLQYLGFDVARPLQAVRGRLRPRFTQLATGLTGSGLRVYFHRDQAGLPGGGARAFIAASALTEAPQPAPPRDELHLRYYVRLSETFDFAGGGVLPGLCLGGCAEGPRNARPGGIIRPRWTPFGELLFDPLPGVRPRDGRWQRLLTPGTWHCIELRVKLNAPGASDGAVDGWLDGTRAVSLVGLRLRDTEATRLQGVWFQTMFRPGGPAPKRDGDVTFDNLAVATGYLGPRTAP